MDFHFDNMNVRRNDMVVLTPVLKSNENVADSVLLPSIVITGTLRDKIMNRRDRLGNKSPFGTTTHTIIKRKNNTPQSVNYQISIPYRVWMDNTLLAVEKNVFGCVNCNEEKSNRLIIDKILLKLDPENYKLSFIVPKAEPVKSRADRHTATFNYIVDQYELLRDYKNNLAQFTQVDKVIGDILENSDFQITEFTITGYASPEGKSDHNRILAGNRANSFANYLVAKFGVSPNKFTVQSFGEDWKGLRKAVAASYLKDKQEVIDIIDKISDTDARDIELMKLSEGKTYKALLNDYYPSLRCTEYVVSYVVRAFNVDEARLIIKTNPKILSLNEMYLVAQSYPSDSKEFKEVFDIAVRLYPDNEVAIVNSAAADIEGKNYDVAIERLLRIEDNPISWNNLGVAHMLKGDSEKAEYYFSKSAKSGDLDGKSNLEVIQRVVDNEQDVI